MIAASPRIVPRPKGLNCPNCGSAIELRAMGAAATVVCSYCSTTLDATNPQLVILQKWQSQITVHPLIPLGSRGKLAETVWEVIGFQQRGIHVEGADYFWREYVLFNPYNGFRYLTEYDNHWNFVTPIPSLPVPGLNHRNRHTMTLDGVTYDHFQSARATTHFVIGEFPWQVKVGEDVGAADYVAPPRSLSCESTENEINWSRGDYLDGRAVWAAFHLPGAAPPARGVYANQPSPVAVPQGRPWTAFFFFAALLLAMMLFFAIRAQEKTVFERTYTYQPYATGEKSFVSEPFDLPLGTANVRVDVTGKLENAWAFVALALINEQTGQAYDFGNQISSYHGVEDGESWTEDSPSDSTLLSGIPGGRYYLRIEPEAEASAGVPPRPVPYSVKVVRDVPFYFRYFLGVFLLLLPLPFLGRKGARFEKLRWAESDYGVPPNAVVWQSSASSGDDNDE